MKFFFFVKIKIFKKTLQNKISKNRFVFKSKSKLKVIGFQNLSSHNPKINTNIPVHELEIIESNNCILYCTNYHGIILEEYKVNLKSIHEVYGNSVSENFRNYPHIIYEALISSPCEIISYGNINYLLCHNWFNYYHFLTETVYKIFATETRESNFTFVFPEGIFESTFVQEIISLLEIKCIKLPNEKSPIFHFDKLFFISEKPHCEEFNSVVIRKMKSFFRTKITIEKHDRKIYVSRKANQRRSFKNHDDVENVFLENGFEIVYAEDLTFTQQLKLFSEACFIAGLHGAGLTNMIFAKDGCKILEIMPMVKKDSSKSNFSIVYCSLAKSLGYSYSMIFTYPSNEDFFEGQFYIESNEIKRHILNQDK